MFETEFLIEDAMNYWNEKDKQIQTFIKILYSVPPALYFVFILLSSQVHMYQPLFDNSNIGVYILNLIIQFVISWFSFGLIIYVPYVIYFLLASYFINNYIEHKSYSLMKKWKEKHPKIRCPYPYSFTNCSDDFLREFAGYLIYPSTFLSILSVSGFVDVAIFPGVFLFVFN